MDVETWAGHCPLPGLWKQPHGRTARCQHRRHRDISWRCWGHLAEHVPDRSPKAIIDAFTTVRRRINNGACRCELEQVREQHPGSPWAACVRLGIISKAPRETVTKAGVQRLDTDDEAISLSKGCSQADDSASIQNPLVQSRLFLGDRMARGGHTLPQLSRGCSVIPGSPCHPQCHHPSDIPMGTRPSCTVVTGMDSARGKLSLPRSAS